MPSRRLRGFEAGRVGPKDGDDFVGGNYAARLNFASTLPQFFEESQNLDFYFLLMLLIFGVLIMIASIDDSGYKKSLAGIALRLV